MCIVRESRPAGFFRHEMSDLFHLNWTSFRSKIYILDRCTQLEMLLCSCFCDICFPNYECFNLSRNLTGCSDTFEYNMNMMKVPV